MAEGQAHGPAGEADEWLNMTQAARRLGWPRERLRSLVRRGKLATRRTNTGELLIRITPELAARAQAEPTLTHGPAHGSDPGSTQGLADADPWADLEADRLRDQAAALGTSLAEAMAQVAGLRLDLAKVQAELEAARAVAAADIEAARRVADAEIAALKATAEAKEAALRELVAELKLQLEHARRPWWRRWLDRT